jgi:1-acyl-sn-glycerol-3-phosphate acyltransferase
MQAEEYTAPKDLVEADAPVDAALLGAAAPRTTSVVWSIWTWIEISAVSITTFVVALTLSLVVFPFDRRRYIVGHVVRLGSVAAVKLNPMWNFRLVGPLPSVKPRKTVCVSNHCSHTDPFLISHLPWDMKWLAKSSLFRIPFLGWAMWLAGDVGVVRGKPQSAKVAMKKCADWLDRGVPIVVFPEGTRATTRELGPFKDGAFRLAIETGSHVLPLAVAGTRTALRKHDWKAHYSRGVLRVGQPISTEGMTLDDIPALKERVRREIEELRTSIRPLASGD